MTRYISDVTTMKEATKRQVRTRDADGDATRRPDEGKAAYLDTKMLLTDGLKDERRPKAAVPRRDA